MENERKDCNVKIPHDLIENELLCFLYPNNFESIEEKQAVELLYKICEANLTDFRNGNPIQDIKISDEERVVIFQNEWHKSENIEVRARCNDLLLRFEKDKREITLTTSNDYLTAYRNYDKIEFLIRAITVRIIKELNDDNFLGTIIEIVQENDIHPFWLNKVFSSLMKSYQAQKFDIIIPLIKEKLQNAEIEHEYQEERHLINVLHSLKLLNTDGYHKEMALSFEKEADFTNNNKQPNTIYALLPDIYQSAYNEIFQIKDREPQIYERIKRKLVIEKQIFADNLSKYGIKTNVPLSEAFKMSIHNKVKKIRLKNYFDTILLFLSVRFIFKDVIDKYKSFCQDNNLESISSTNRIDLKGNTIGEANPEDSIRTEAHQFYRQKILYEINAYFDLHRWSKIKVYEDEVYVLLKKFKPQFIEEHALIFWSKGICFALNDDFISASHILMPQLEHALHNILEIKCGVITTLEKKRQESPTLGKILPELKNIFEDEILFEIDSFLQKGIDVNFRNNLSHGLFTPFEVQVYGLYLFWICLKLFFDKNLVQTK